MTQLAERQKNGVGGYDDIEIFGYHHEDSKVVVSYFMRGGLSIQRNVLGGSEHFDPGSLFVVKQYYLDARFIRIDPSRWSLKTGNSGGMADRCQPQVEIRSPQRASSADDGLVHRNAHLLSATLSAATTSGPHQKDVEVAGPGKTPRRTNASIFQICREAISWHPWWSVRTDACRTQVIAGS
jgi:hypothetical protein